MRALADEGRIRLFMRALGAEARAAARVYLTGGATAVLHGWRASTIDIDIKIVPDVDSVFRAISALKERLHINVELAPSLPLPRDRSRLVPAGGRGPSGARPRVTPAETHKA